MKNAYLAELRKIFNTRGATVSLAIMLVLYLVFMVGAAVILGKFGTGIPWQVVNAAGSIPVLIIMSIIAVNKISEDSTYRTWTWHIPLCRNRSQLHWAKWLAVLTLAVALVPISYGLGLLASNIVGVFTSKPVVGPESGWGKDFFDSLLGGAMAAIFALGVASLIRKPIVALLVIVASFSLLPTVFMLLGWRAWQPFFVPLTVVEALSPKEDGAGFGLQTYTEAKEWFAFASSLTLWFIIPNVLGWKVFQRANY